MTVFLSVFLGLQTMSVAQKACDPTDPKCPPICCVDGKKICKTDANCSPAGWLSSLVSTKPSCNKKAMKSNCSTASQTAVASASTSPKKNTPPVAKDTEPQLIVQSDREE
ncbi:MAG: hypothetical protein AAF587_17150 [Bacteroidota bacterium]